MGGFNLPYGITIVNKTNKQAYQLSTYVLGIAGSFQFTENLSLDLNIQLQDYIGTAIGVPKSDLIIYSDLGQYIGKSKVQIIASFSYQQSQFDLKIVINSLFIQGFL